MTCKDRIMKLKSMPKGPAYYFAAACHNFLTEIERDGLYIFDTLREAEVHQQGIKEHFKVKTKRTHTTLTL